jgi:hypothetical protein
MAFDFNKMFGDALAAGTTPPKPGGKAAEDWLRESARANEDTLRAIAEGIKSKQISKESGVMLLRENARALQSEAAALSVIVKATAQAAINAFVNSLTSALSKALKIAL